MGFGGIGYGGAWLWIADLLAGALTPTLPAGALAARCAPGGGPGMMGSYGVAPTAPAGTSVRMARSGFEPVMIRTAPAQPVRWFDDDTARRTVRAERVDLRTIRIGT